MLQFERKSSETNDVIRMDRYQKDIVLIAQDADVGKTAYVLFTDADAAALRDKLIEWFPLPVQAELTTTTTTYAVEENDDYNRQFDWIVIETRTDLRPFGHSETVAGARSRAEAEGIAAALSAGAK